MQSGAGFWESWKLPVTPRSLYYQQLEDRLGASAVDAVRLARQRQGSIWDVISAWAGYGDLSGLLSEAEDAQEAPGKYMLYQSYPNPFNPTAMIRYELKAAGPVRLAVFDLLGREIAVLVNETQTSGTKSAVWSAKGQSAGTYFCRLRAAGNSGEQFSAVKRMVLLK